MLNIRLKELRKLNKVTQKQVAESVNMAERAYQRIEAGYNPNHENLIAIADYFNVSLDYLVGRTDKPEINK